MSNKFRSTRESSYLVVGEDEGIGNNDVFSSSSIEHNNLGDVVGSERLTSTVVSGLLALRNSHVDWRDSRIYGIGLGLVAIESDNRKFLAMWLESGP